MDLNNCHLVCFHCVRYCSTKVNNINVSLFSLFTCAFEHGTELLMCTQWCQHCKHRDTLLIHRNKWNPYRCTTNMNFKEPPRFSLVSMQTRKEFPETLRPPYPHRPQPASIKANSPRNWLMMDCNCSRSTAEQFFIQKFRIATPVNVISHLNVHLTQRWCIYKRTYS